jgi:hypothetical protein
MAFDLLSKSTESLPNILSVPESGPPSFFLFDCSEMGPSKTELYHFSSYLDLDGGRSVSSELPSAGVKTLDENVGLYLVLWFYSSAIAVD